MAPAAVTFGGARNRCACPHPSRVLFALVLSLFLATAECRAQMIEFSSSMNPVGSGARATGMGGAFIAVADDATAASWNPAGLINLEKPELSFVYSYFNRSHSYDSTSHPELGERDQEMDVSDINYASLAYPFKLFDRNMIATLNYQRLYDMNKQVDVHYLWDTGGGDTVDDRIGFSQKGYLGAISPAFAVQLLPELYLGATLNIWNDFAGTTSWENSYHSSGVGTLSGTVYDESVEWTNKYTFSGVNANLGLLYTLNGKYSFGLVYKLPFSADVTRKTTLNFSQTFPSFPAANTVLSSTTSERLTMKMPASYGFGVAYRHSDSLLLALDLYRTMWSDFVIIDAAGNRKNPITGGDISDGRPGDTTQVRLGGEYLFIGEKVVVPLRAGFFYDPEPAEKGTDAFYGISAGSGVSFDRYAFDLSYQYRWGNGVTGDIPDEGITSDVGQHTVMASLIYYF